MVRRLTDTYFVKCEFSIRLENNSQRLSTKTSTGIYIIPEETSVAEFIKTATERQVKHDFGNDYRIADFLITEITPL